MDFENNAPAGQGPASANVYFDKVNKIIRGYIYADDLLCLRYLSDTQKGQLLEAINMYMFSGIELEPMDDIVHVAFAPIKQHIQRDHEAYLTKCTTNRNNSLERNCFKSRQSSDSIGIFREPSKVVDPNWRDQEIAGCRISALELHRASNLFFWKNYPPDQVKACYDFYGQRKEGWGQWSTPSSRWTNAISKWTNRTGKNRFTPQVLVMIGAIYDIAPDSVRYALIRKDFGVILSKHTISFTYNHDSPLKEWLGDNFLAISKIVSENGYNIVEIN